MSNVFLSYGQSDRDVATPFVKKLEEAGYTVFNSSDIPAEDKVWREAIREAVKKTDLLIIIIPNSGVENSWLSYEIGLAEALGKKITLLMSNTDAVLPEGATKKGHNILSFNPEEFRSVARSLNEQAGNPAAARVLTAAVSST